MHLARTGGSSQTHWPWGSPARLALRALTRGLASVCPASYIHLPVPLRSTPVTALPSSYGDSDSSTSLLLSRSPRFTSHVAQNHSASKHPTPPHRRFHTLPLSSMGLPSRGQGFTFG